MATFDYAPLTQTARDLLARFGQQVTLSRTTAPVYDPVTGEYTGGGTETATVNAAILPVGGMEGQEYGEGGLIRSSDRKALIESAGFEPDEATTLTDAGGGAWNIETVVEVAPAGDVVVYKAVLRR